MIRYNTRQLSAHRGPSLVEFMSKFEDDRTAEDRFRVHHWPGEVTYLYCGFDNIYINTKENRKNRSYQYRFYS